MASETLSTLRVLLRRQLPKALERVEIADRLAADRAALGAMVELLGDAALQRKLMAGDGAAAEGWLRERIAALVATAAAEPGDGRDVSVEPGDGRDASVEPGDEACVRELAAGWVDEYLAGKLPPSAERGLWLHLDDCSWCRARYRTICSAQEGRREGASGEEARVERLLRGLPWSVAEPASDSAPASDPAPASDSAPASDPAPAPDPAPEGDESPSRFWLTRRGRIAVYCLAMLLFVGANLLLLLAPRGPSRRSVTEQSTAPALAPLPEQPLSIGLLRYQADAPNGAVWLSVQGAVAGGDRLLLTYSIGEGKGEERGRPRHLALLAVFDRAPPIWLRPAPVTPGQPTSPPVTVPAAAVRLPTELRVPTGASRMVIFAVLTDRPVPLGLIQQKAVAASRAPGFFSSPPLLDVDRSLQAHLSLDVL